MLGRLRRELIGLELKVVSKYVDEHDNPIVERYTIIDVYPHCVLALKIAESGAEIMQSFSVGDLITMGTLRRLK